MSWYHLHTVTRLDHASNGNFHSKISEVTVTEHSVQIQNQSLPDFSRVKFECLYLLHLPYPTCLT